MHHIAYQTHQLSTGMAYYGIHSTRNIDDGYLGSGAALKRAVKRCGRRDFVRYVVREFKTRKEALEWEERNVTERQVANPACFNQQTGGTCGIPSEESRARMRKAQSNRKPLSAEARRRMSESGKRRPPISEATRKKLSDKMKAREPYRHTPESKAAMSKARLGRPCPRTKEWQDKLNKAKQRPVEINGKRYEGMQIAADEIGVNRLTIRRWIASGKHGARRLTAP